MGDLNICLLKESNNNFNGLTNMMNRFYFTPLIDKPTRITNTTASLIDHIWVNFVCRSESNIVISNITDHYLCFSNFDRINNNNKEIIKLKFRDFSTKNKTNFINSVNQTDWFSVLSDSIDPDVQTNTLFDKLNSLYNGCFPLKTKHIGKKRLMNPWLSSGILKSIRLKHDKYKLYLNGLLSKISYKFYCKLLSRVIRSSKRIYYCNFFDRHKNNMKSTWCMINKIINSKYKPKKYVEIQLNNELIDNEVLPSVFNDYFANIGLNLKSKINSHDNVFTDFLPAPLRSSVFISPTTIDEVNKTISSIKSTKNTINKFGSCALKLVSSALSLPIKIIFNNIIETGLYPSRLKIACVVPIFKSGNKKDIENYRPISTLSCINTVIEKLLFKRINSFLNSNHVLVDTQYGFRSGRTTSDALLRLLYDAYQSMNSHNYFGVVSLDLSKAFDTVDHKILLYKL